MQICPYCYQDAVWNVRLSSDPSVTFRMCFECDSIWRPNERISDEEGANFEQYMQELGQKVDWNNLEKISEVS